MIKIYADKNKNLSFDLDIAGTNVNPEEVQLVLEGENNTSLIIFGKAEGNKVSVDIMSESIQDYIKIYPSKNSISAKLNVIIEGKRFSPWDGDFEIVKPIEVKVVEEKVTGLAMEAVSAKICENIDDEIERSQPMVEEVVKTKKLTMKEKLNVSLEK